MKPTHVEADENREARNTTSYPTPRRPLEGNLAALVGSCGLGFVSAQRP
jgi:hypothetical protein